MAKPYSMDLRERVTAAVVRGRMSCRRAAKRFGVAASTAIGWVKPVRTTGTAAPGQMGGHRARKITGEHRDWLVERCKSGDFMLRGLVSELAGRGLKFDCRTLWAFARRNLSYKKSGWPASKTDPTSRRRRYQVGLTLHAWSSSMNPGPRPTRRH